MSVERVSDIIRFKGAFRPQHFGAALSAFNDFLLGKPEKIILDFAECTEAFPNTILPTIAMANRFRQMNYQIFATLPKDSTCKSRFLGSNWAHFLSPEHHRRSDDLTEPHLVCQQFGTAKEHLAISRGIIDLILKSIVTTRSALGMLEWVINEVMDNVINHSESVSGGFVQLAIFPPSKKFAFCVVDSGRGILSSLQPTFPQLTSDRLAIQESVKSGVTRDKNLGQGNGLSGSLTLAMQTGGRFQAMSGKAAVLWEGDEPQVIQHEFDYFGTMIDIQLPYGQEYDFSKLLAQGSSSPYYVPIDHNWNRLDRHSAYISGREAPASGHVQRD